MTLRRRRPLLREEKDQRSVRQVATGRGQANARPVISSPTRTKVLGAEAVHWQYDWTESWHDTAVISVNLTAGAASTRTVWPGSGSAKPYVDGSSGTIKILRPGLYLVYVRHALTIASNGIVVFGYNTNSSTDQRESAGAASGTRTVHASYIVPMMDPATWGADEIFETFIRSINVSAVVVSSNVTIYPVIRG